jgi:diguanylate cyclase (GGDEF)-like protein
MAHRGGAIAWFCVAALRVGGQRADTTSVQDVVGTEGVAGPADGPEVAAERSREVMALVPSLMAVCVATVVLLVAAVPRYGYLPFVVLGAAAALNAIVDRLAPRSDPQDRTTGTVIAFALVVGIVVVQTGGPASFVLPWVINLALANFLVHSVREATRLAWLTLVVSLVPLAIADPSSIIRQPWLIAGCAQATLCMTVIAGYLTNAEIRHRIESVIDPLTGLLNRRSLVQRFDEVRQQSAVLGTTVPLSVIMIDVDHFKVVNDTHGHAAGDAVLRDVAYELRKVLRRFDAVFRIGGEEFVVLVPDATASAAAVLAERLRTAVADRSPGGIEVTISLGVVADVAGTVDLEALLEGADRALYEAKATGRNRVVVAGS